MRSLRYLLIASIVVGLFATTPALRAYALGINFDNRIKEWTWVEFVVHIQGARTLGYTKKESQCVAPGMSFSKDVPSASHVESLQVNVENPNCAHPVRWSKTLTFTIGGPSKFNIIGNNGYYQIKW